jgi:hypothetical protein
MDIEVQRTAEADLVALVRLAHAAVEFGVIGFPDELAGPDAVKVQVALAEAEHGLAVAGFHLIDASAFLLFVGPAGIEDEAVAGLERCDELQGHMVASDAGYFAEEDAPLGAEAGVG